MTSPNDLPSGVATDFRFCCNICGASVEVVLGIEQPHHCRIVLVGDYEDGAE